ncbi:hypothetical protein Poli38472_010443 [Pythium oligandrum]|uniref:glutathione gamma-glutamylcysteinyltransferase n=1 Tax=Pythium oligandrum TaxID=41045 RepID=A0A8K1FAY8_PYTOL|nr:hypothetical protein Poli38472_010443 [Pythium oligandrum]|eukprot:TMW55561.1 hypothetical protein Poli38472_010443 [Pythium oligandrum]
MEVSPSPATTSCACACTPDKPNATVVAPTAPSSALTPSSSFHRRDLPSDCVSFSSPQGKRLFLEAVNASPSYMESYFPLAEQFITQAEPAYCGLATLAMCLNALQIDPGRLWKGPWRWFSEELLDCCTPLEVAKANGISFDVFVCLAKCNGAMATNVRATSALTLDTFRELVRQSCSETTHIVVLNYSRKVLGQTGDGHFSPIGGYHAAEDMVLLLDVARFKYPPHWIKLELAFASMQRVDESSGLPRGLVVLSENLQVEGGPLPVNRPPTFADGLRSCCAAVGHHENATKPE